MLTGQKFIFGIFVLFFLCGSLHSQDTPSAPVELTPNVKAILKDNDVADFAPEYKFFIENYRQGRFSPEVKEDFKISLLKLEAMRIRVRYDLRDLFEAIQFAKEKHKFDGEQMKNLSHAIRGASEQFNRVKFLAYLKTLHGFMKDTAIYTDRYQSVYFRNATYQVLLNEDGTQNDEVLVVKSSSNLTVEEALARSKAGYKAPEPKPRDPMTEELPEQFKEFGQVIHLIKGDLVLASTTDTAVIEGTSGYFRFDKNVFIGQDGLVDWSDLGMPQSEMKVRLRNYELAVNQRSFKFEDVLFNQPAKIESPIGGELYLNIRPSRNERGTYPRFVSYNANTPIKGLGSEKITFKGGINYEGLDFYSRSLYEETAVITGTIDGVKRFTARSKDFTFNNNDSTVSSKDAELTIYHMSDSVYHPAVEFDYDYEKDLLQLETSVKGYKTTPFRSSYYNMDISGDALSWDLNSDSLNFAINSARADVPLMLESKDFYSNAKFEDLAQIFNFHPLLMAVNMAENAKGDVFYTSQMARDKNLDESLVKKTMELLMSRGMVKFDRLTGRVEVLEKGYHYAAAGRKDPNYDDILIPSIIDNAPNATMSFKDSVLTVRGVQRFVVSDSLDVLIAPEDGVMRVLKNRDIEFNGSLNAGNFQFNGTNFRFRYDSFLVNMEKIDSIKLQVINERGQREELSNKLVGTSGKILINEPDNKSAFRSLPEYPIFSSTKSANVYFGKKDVLKGAYDSTVYFDVPPFVLDSVADADPSKYAFQGTFYSGGILPVFEESLKLMKDKSFGFQHAIPDSGYNLYSQGARLYGDLKMDENGLSTPGNIEYLTGTFTQERATLFLDSLVAPKGIKATLTRGIVDTVSFPSMSLEAYDMNFLAKRDSMVLKNLEFKKPFQIFDNQAQLRGEMVLRKVGLFGAGEMEINGAKLTSDSISFNADSFKSRHTEFTLAAPNTRKPILTTSNSNVNFDVDNALATIEPGIAGEASLEFPFAQFKTSIPTALWDVNQKSVTMTKPESVPIEQSFFYSTNKRLDSLAFSATAGFYDIEKKELNVKGIPFIKVADAKITPQGNELTILENSRIEKLENAVILIDTANAYHRIFNAEVEILSRTQFRGQGTYELVNAQADTFSIQFDQFQFVENDEVHGPHTKSSGRVLASQEVVISPGFIYEGELTMYAYKKALELNGAVKLDLQKLSERNVWIEHASNDDVEEVVIPFDQAVTREGSPLNAGLHFDSRRNPYMSFITEKRDPADDDFFVPRGGNLFYDNDRGAYKIENPAKSQNPELNYAGSMFSYQESTQDVTFEGRLNFLAGPKGTNVQASGKGDGNLESMEFDLDAMFVLSFGLPVEGLAAIGQNLTDMAENLGVTRALSDRSELIYRVAEFIGDDATREWDESYGTVPIPLATASPNGELIKDLVISNVHMKWSKQTNSFYSEGPIGVSNVSNIDLNMELQGFIEVRKTREGDIITILLQMTDGTWYFFNYDGFSFTSFSSNEIYNATVLNTNKGKTQIGSFKVSLGSIPQISNWARDFRKLYYGIDEPYKLLMSTESSQTLKKKKAVTGDGF
ncbi:hypothetical protein [Roseivirga misakiensis]|uniref:Uncharacterized protein n=1 Tax=Roseivirga misakiensis TaxID=1563681 RepID=A0A1E5T7T5_9BACT|nr:hypothetical protein [Roseivirga misakiensis]OEK07445.1 hypothetical protein BFP71_00100 [Roseivirga misakiensis]